jgi:hypothetical protein
MTRTATADAAAAAGTVHRLLQLSAATSGGHQRALALMLEKVLLFDRKCFDPVVAVPQLLQLLGCDSESMQASPPLDLVKSSSHRLLLLVAATSQCIAPGAASACSRQPLLGRSPTLLPLSPAHVLHVTQFILFD